MPDKISDDKTKNLISSAESKNQEEAESSLIKGLEVFNGFLQIARRELVEILKDWEEKASAHNQLLIPHQRSLLKQKDDPRVFNQELFQFYLV